MKNEIIVPILNYEYKVIVCWGNSEEIKKVLHRWNYPKNEITTDYINEALTGRRGVCFNNPDLHPIIAIPRKPRKPQEIATLAHESVHAINFIMRKISEYDEVGEVFAHSVGAIVREVLSKK